LLSVLGKKYYKGGFFDEISGGVILGLEFFDLSR